MRSSDAWQIIDFQASEFGSRHDVLFWVNLGVAFDSIQHPDAPWDPFAPAGPPSRGEQGWGAAPAPPRSAG